MMKSSSKRDVALWYLERFVGLPYRWGGSTPIVGFDCSGLMVEVLASVGLLPHKADFSAQDLYLKFKDNKSDPKPGCLVFYGKDKITHVEMVYKLVPEPLNIGASGGDETTLTKDDANLKQAFIKMRPLRSGHVGIVDPFK